LFALPAESPVFQGMLPDWLDFVVTVFLWVWFVNLFNFMDGIDGISGIETIAIAGGVAALGLFGDTAAMPLTLAVTAAALGFLVWNWPPARIFLGDVGSVPLGYLLGWILLGLAAAGQWPAAVILPLYYLADATITLLRRLLRGEKVWRAHRDHFYQRPVRKGATHLAVILPVAATNLFLVGLALATVLTGAVWTPILLACLVVGVLLAFLATHRGDQTARPSQPAD
jgi:UDP-N-acetylmuramyl pentapeptide phosphotransferase/UDP-N-acetylglucosamine-1-phosphate transferase